VKEIKVGDIISINPKYKNCRICGKREMFDRMKQLKKNTYKVTSINRSFKYMGLKTASLYGVNFWIYNCCISFGVKKTTHLPDFL